MNNLFKFLLGPLFLLISFLVAPISTTIILGLFLLWCLGWLIMFLVVFIPRARAAWAEVKAEDEEWDALLEKYWNTEYLGYLNATRTAGWSPVVAKLCIQQTEDAKKAKSDAEIEMINANYIREESIVREKKIAYWIARRATKRKHKANKTLTAV